MIDIIIAVTETVYGVHVWEDVTVDVTQLPAGVLRTLWTIINALPDAVRFALA